MNRRSIFHRIVFSRLASVLSICLTVLALTATACNPAAPTQNPNPTAQTTQEIEPTEIANTPAPQPAAPTSATQAAEDPGAGAGKAGLPNPASVYCEENSGKLEIRTDAAGGQYGVCIFPNGSECEEWAFFRKECSPWELEPTPDVDLTQNYQNTAFSFSLAYPDGWRLEEAADSLRLHRDEYTLFIGFWKTGQERPLFRTGMPEGEFIDSGAYTLLGQTIPRRYLVSEGKVKLVDYGVGLSYEDLSLIIWLDKQDQPPLTYRDRNLPVFIIQEAEAILNSFSRTTEP